MEAKNHICELRIKYCRATRCWRSNNLKSCLLICDDLTKKLNKLIPCEDIDGLSQEVAQLKHLIWFLKIRCLADDYYINESLLLNEEDIEGEDQVRIFCGTNHSKADSTARITFMETRDGGIGRKITTGGGKIDTRHRTGILTGRMPSVSSRQSSRGATSSYRPLTTSLTATQTAFSRSTRPLLKYSTCTLLSKLLFEYLYNAQTVTNKCPDYRQCLEYLNLVQNTIRKQAMLKRDQQNKKKDNASCIGGSDGIALISTSESMDERKSMGVFWLVAFGTCYFNLHMNKQAEDYFQRAIAINPKYLDSYTWLVKIYLRSNQPNKVLKTCEDGLTHSKNAILYNWLARVQSLINDLYAANSNLRESLKYYPTNIEALANVGHFSFYSDKLEQSIKCFERIQQLSVNQSASMDDNHGISGSSAQLLNNLALCNFYCGFYQKVMPLFIKSILNSPSKEITSNIWYNISFVPLSCGFNNLAIACLRLALKNDSQNEEAINNLGVLKYGNLVNDHLHYINRQELWSKSTNLQVGTLSELKNVDDQDNCRTMFDDAETYFSPSNKQDSLNRCQDTGSCLSSQPEMLYNMALIKYRRGQLLASVRYCNQYLEHDPNNYHIRDMLKEIRQLVSHDG